jgi:hypothetical protein
MFFKQIMSDFAFNRGMDKVRKTAKTNHFNNSACIASLNETLALKFYTGNRNKVVEQLLLECITLYKKQCAANSDTRLHDVVHADNEYISFCCVQAHAIIEKDVEEDFITGDDLLNKMKVLVNLKLLPEYYLTLDIQYSDAVA